MSFISILLWALGAYYALGVLFAFRFVFFIAPRIDPVFKEAPMRVRVLFFPGDVAVWPMALARASALLKIKSGDEA